MGTGSSALFWYIACLAFVGLVVSVAAGLIIWGRFAEERARAKRRARRADAASPEAESPDGDEPPPGPA